MCRCRSRTPSFFFVCEKERGGRKKKPYPTDAREKDTSNFSVLSTRDCDRAVGETPTGRTRLRPVLHPPCRKYILKNIRRYSSQQRLSAGKRVLFPRYERADARSILERSPKLYNPVGSPRLKTASPINQNKIIPRLRLPSTDPVWARRPKPARPARAERPPLSLCSPCAAEPLGSWSPDFSVRVVTQARGGAGRKQNGLPRQLAGVPMATRALKVCISLAGDRSPQRHRGCREAGSGPPPAGWFSQGFFFLPRLSFSRTKKKDGVRGGSQP